MYKLKSIYKETSENEKKSNLEIKFSYPIYLTSGIEKRMNYLSEFIDELPTIKNYLETKEKYKQDNPNKRIFHKLSGENLITLRLTRPLFQLFKGINIDISAKARISLEKALNLGELDVFLRDGWIN